MPRYLALALASILLAIGLSRPNATTEAAPFVFETDMYGTNQVPPVNSIGWGFVRFFFSEDRLSADYTVDVKGFSGSLVLGADIHRGSPGTNGPVIHHLADGGFITTSGHLKLTPADLDDMATGLWYASLKTTLHPEGEMRGQIVLPATFRLPPPGPVQEPPAPPPAAVPAAEPAVDAPAPPAAAPAGALITPPNTGDGGLAGLEREPLGAALVGLSGLIFGVGFLVVSGRI